MASSHSHEPQKELPLGIPSQPYSSKSLLEISRRQGTNITHDICLRQPRLSLRVRKSTVPTVLTPRSRPALLGFILPRNSTSNSSVANLQLGMSSDISLIDEVRSCTICAGLPLGPRPILQVHPDARVLIAGQAPGRITHEKGIPFDDPSGNRLRDWLGIDKEEFYDPRRFANVPMGFCFPGTGKGGDLPPRPECAPSWRDPILGSMPNIELTLVIGKYAMNWHLPEHSKKSVTELVADWERFWPSILPLPHPSPRNNRWLKQNPMFERQLLPLLKDRIRELF
jgi:uracil-DNA glycosylase